MAVRRATSRGSQLRQVWDRVGWHDTLGNLQFMLGQRTSEASGGAECSLESRVVLSQGSWLKSPSSVTAGKGLFRCVV